MALVLVTTAPGAGAAPTATTIRTSVASDDTQGNDMSGRLSRPAISADGRFTAFDSLATNLVPGDTNQSVDVFVHDSASGVTDRVSVSSAGQQANEDSAYPSIDGQGRFVAFDSSADNLVPNDTNRVSDVFVRDRLSGKTFRASVDANGGNGNASSFWASISADGRFVAFVSDASDLVIGDTNHVRDIFVRDLLTRTTELVSVASDETLANSDSATPSISADGHAVAFMSFASNLVPNDTNGHFDVFVRDRTAGTTVLASVRADGVQGNQDSLYPAISGNGAFVAFPSDATNLVRNDTNDRRDVFLRDLGSDRLMRVSVAGNGAQANGQSVGPGVRGGLVFGPAINFDGTRIAFDSVATNLVPGDRNTCEPFFPGEGQCPDIFVRDWSAGTTTRVSVTGDGFEANDASTDPAMDASGQAVAFFSAASNLVAGDTNFCIQFPTTGHCPDIFVRTA